MEPIQVHARLFQVLASTSSITERHNKEIVPFFLEFMTKEHDQFFEGASKTQDITVRIFCYVCAWPATLSFVMYTPGLLPCL